MSAIIVVLDLSTPEHKDWKMEHDMSLSLFLRKRSTSDEEFARTAVTIAKSVNPSGSSYADWLVAHIEDPSPELLSLLTRMSNHCGGHFDSPVGRSKLLPLLSPGVIREGYWRDPSGGQCRYGWYPDRLDDENPNPEHSYIEQDWGFEPREAS